MTAASLLGKFLALTPRTPEASTVPEPHGKGKGLWGHPGWMAPPYMEHVAGELMKQGHSESDAYHMADGIVRNWSRGHDGQGHKVHPDVRAAAVANMAKWEELKAKARAERAGKSLKGGHSGDKAAASAECGSPADILELALYAASFLPGGSAPGARPLSGSQLRQAPSQSVSPSPPLPPGVRPPDARELRALASQVQQAGDSGLLLSASKHIGVAANMVATGDQGGALRMLRTAATGIRAANEEANASAPPVAPVFSVPPAERSSALAAMAESRARRDAYRGLYTAVATQIDRIRRSHYRGMYGNTGFPSARFSAGETATERVLRLAKET